MPLPAAAATCARCPLTSEQTLRLSLTHDVTPTPRGRRRNEHGRGRPLAAHGCARRHRRAPGRTRRLRSSRARVLQPIVRGAAAGSALMDRAIILLYDDARQLVVVVGGHGVDAGLLSELSGTLEETPGRPAGAVRGPRRGGHGRPRALGARALRADRAAWRRCACVPVSADGSVARGDLRRPRRQPLRAHRRRAPRPVDARQDRRARGRACASRPASRAAPGCSRRASTSRARSTSA